MQEPARELPNPRAAGRSLAWSLLKWLVSLSLLGLAVYLLDVEAIMASASKVHWIWLLLAAAVAFPHFFVLGARWHYMTRSVAPARALRHLSDYLLSVFFNSITPGYVGGDVFRFARMQRVFGACQTLALLLRERGIGLVSFIIVYELCFALTMAKGGLPPLARTLLGEVALGLALLAVLALPLEWLAVRLARLPVVSRRPRLGTVFEVLRLAVRWRPVPEMAALLLFGIVGCVPWLLSIRVLVEGMGMDVSLPEIGLVFVLVELVRVIPISIQGIGVREGMCALLFGVLGHQPADGFALGAVAYVAFQISLLAASGVGWGIQLTLKEAHHVAD